MTRKPNLSATEDIATARLVRVCQAARLAQLGDPDALRIAYDRARALRLMVEAKVDRTLIRQVARDLMHALHQEPGWPVVQVAFARFEKDILDGPLFEIVGDLIYDSTDDTLRKVRRP